MLRATATIPTTPTYRANGAPKGAQATGIRVPGVDVGGGGVSRFASSFVFVVIVSASITVAPLPRPPVYAADQRSVDARTGLLEIPADELVAAVKRKDRAEVGRVAERLGPARLAQALRRTNSAATVNAAMTGILAIPGRARLLGPLTELVNGGEAAFVATALRTMGEILAPMTASDLDDWEIPADVVHAACSAMRSTLAFPASSTADRLAAIDALADAAVACAATSPPPDLPTLLRDPSPAIRRAAILMTRPQQRWASPGFAVGIRDFDKTVTGATAAALCESMAFRGFLTAAPGAAAGQASASGRSSVRELARDPNWEPARQVARRMINAPDTSADDAVQMLDCLDVSVPSDRQLLERIRTRRRTPVGDRAAEILAALPPGRTTP